MTSPNETDVHNELSQAFSGARSGDELSMRPVFLEDSALHIFPCRADKRPTTPHGYLDAVSNAPSIARLWSRYPGPLVGVATGAVSGIDVIDVDEKGEGWFHAHRDQLPATRTHKTRREGLHLIYRHSVGLRCSTSKIAPGIDVKADGGYIIWWPASSGRVVFDGPVVPFPAWVINLLHVDGHNGEKCSLLSSEISLNSNRQHLFPLLPTKNLSRRVERILRVVERAQPGTRNDRLFWAACRLAEIVAEGRLQPAVAKQLLSSAAWLCGLTRDDGARAALQVMELAKVRFAAGSSCGRWPPARTVVASSLRRMKPNYKLAFVRSFANGTGYFVVEYFLISLRPH